VLAWVGGIYGGSCIIQASSPREPSRMEEKAKASAKNEFGIHQPAVIRCITIF